MFTTFDVFLSGRNSRLHFVLGELVLNSGSMLQITSDSSASSPLQISSCVTLNGSFNLTLDPNLYANISRTPRNFSVPVLNLTTRFSTLLMVFSQVINFQCVNGPLGS